ncbi:MAG: hypothetical protein MR629_03955 [Helicobacter sp.]|nr:hypothetical protein [Helicobacter sp.]
MKNQITKSVNVNIKSLEAKNTHCKASELRVSIAAALSLGICVSTMAAHNHFNRTESKNGWTVPSYYLQLNGKYSSYQSGALGSHTTTLVNKKLYPQIGSIRPSNFSNLGYRSNLVIQATIKNESNSFPQKNVPILELNGEGANTILNRGHLERTMRNGDKDLWNIMFRGGSHVELFRNDGVIKSNEDTIYLYTQTTKDNQPLIEYDIKNTVVKNFTNTKTIEATGGRSALRIQGSTIKNFLNDTTGIIKAKETAIKVEDILSTYDSRTTYRTKGVIETLINRGTIEGKKGISFNSTRTHANKATNTSLKTFENSIGTIKATEIAVDLIGVDVDTFKADGGLIESKQSSAINISASNITNFTHNRGTIKSESQNASALKIDNSKVKKLSNNGSVTSSSQYAIQVSGGEVTDFENLQQGVLESKSAGGSAVLFDNTKVNSIKNSGTLKAQQVGLEIKYTNNQASIQSVENSGVIEVKPTANTNEKSAGIFFNNTTALNVREIKNSNQIKGGNYGILIEKGSVGNIIHSSGTIEGKKDGIKLGSNSKVENLQVNGIIKGTESAINNEGTLKKIVIGLTGQIDGKIQNKNNDLVIENSGVMRSDIVNTGSGSLTLNNGSSTELISGLKGNIDNQGSGTFRLHNAGMAIGNITNSGTGALIVENQKGGRLDGVIKNSGNGDMVIVNRGTASEKTKVVNGNNGAITIQEWAVSIKQPKKPEAQPATPTQGSGQTSPQQPSTQNPSSGSSGQASASSGASQSASGTNQANASTQTPNTSGSAGQQGNQQTAQNQSGSQTQPGSNQSTGNTGNQVDGYLRVEGDNVRVDQITITGTEQAENLRNLNVDNLTNANTGGTQITTREESISVQVSENGSLNFSTESSRTAAVALSRASTTTNSARTMFVQSVMSSALNTLSYMNTAGNTKGNTKLSGYQKGSLYANANTVRTDVATQSHSYGASKNNLFFIMPYLSFSKVELDKGEFSTGKTEGLILGYSFFAPKSGSIYGIYAGYDEFSSKSKTFQMNNKAYYAGLKYYTPLGMSAGTQFYFKASAQGGLIKGQLIEKLESLDNKGTPTSYTYAASSDVGANFMLGKSTLSPEVGVGYEGSTSQEYTLKNDVNSNTKTTQKHHTNLYKLRTQLSWFMDWHRYFKTVLNGGAEYTLNPVIANPKVLDSRFDGFIGGTSKVDPLLGFVGATIAFPLDERLFISVSYNGNFTQVLTMHTGYIKLNFMW